MQPSTDPLPSPGIGGRHVRVMPARSGPGPASQPKKAGPPHPGGAVPAVEIVLAAAHGGAGATTLAALLQPAWDVGAPRDRGRGIPPLVTGGRPIVLVARNTTPAAGAAIATVNAITRPGGRVAVLAVVSDGLPEPAEARYRFRLLEARVGGVVRVPFVPAFRAVGHPAAVELPRRARKALAEIRELTTGPARPPVNRA